jgi:hypothetical protein
MDFSPIYIAHRFAYRVVAFFYHWYVDGSRYFGYKFVSFFRGLDQGFAIKVTLEHFFEPLYKDYSALGRVLGVIFRSGRVLLGSVFYLVFGIVFISAYIVWLLIPLTILFLSFRNVAVTDLWETVSAIAADSLTGVMQGVVSAVRGLLPNTPAP